MCTIYPEIPKSSRTQKCLEGSVCAALGEMRCPGCRYNIKVPRYSQMIAALTWMSHSQNLRRMAREYVIDLCALLCYLLSTSTA